MHIPHLSDIVQDFITAYHRLYSQLRQPNCPLLFARVCCTALAAGEVRGVIPARTWAVRAVVQRTTKRNQGAPSTRARTAEEESATARALCSETQIPSHCGKPRRRRGRSARHWFSAQNFSIGPLDAARYHTNAEFRRTARGPVQQLGV